MDDEQLELALEIALSICTDFDPAHIEYCLPLIEAMCVHPVMQQLLAKIEGPRNKGGRPSERECLPSLVQNRPNRRSKADKKDKERDDEKR